MADLDDPEFTASSGVDISRPGCRVVCLRAGQHGAVEDRAGQVGAAKIRMAKVGTLQVRALQVGAAEVRPSETRMPEVAASQVRVREIASVEARSRQLSTGEVGVSHLDSRQLGPVELKTAQVHPRQIKDPRIRRGRAEAQDAHCCLNIGSTDAHPGQVLVHGCGGMLRAVRRSDRPACVVTHKGTEEVLDGVAVVAGVLGDAFERVDTANTHINVLAAQLIHGPGKSLGDLAFAADVDLPPSRCGAGNYQQSGEALQYCRPGIIDQLGLAC